MPLEHGSSREAFSRNVSELMKNGHSQSQSLAIAYKEKEGRDSAEGTVKAAGILYLEDNHVLVLKRLDGSWAFPGGKIEPDEKPVDAARRESGEEVGYVPDPDQLWEIDFSNNGRVQFTTFCCRTGFEPILNTDEHSEFRWCPLDQLPDVMHPNARATIEKYAKTYLGTGLDSARQLDVNGWIEIKDNPISRSGVFEYYGKQIDRSLDPNKKYRVLRSPEELAKQETIDSFKLIPWIDEHVMLGPSDSGMLPPELKGIEGVIGEDVYFELSSGMLKANIKVFSDNLDELIARGKRELSAGYRCKYKISAGVFEGQPYDVEQYDIRGNHLALVNEGRMGPDVAVLDQMTFTFDARDAMAEKDLKEAIDSLTQMVKDGFKAYDAKFEGMDARVKDMEEEPDPAPAADKHGKDAKTGKDETEEEKKSREDKEASDRKSGMDAAIRSAMDAALAPVLAKITNIETAHNQGRDAGAKQLLLEQLGHFGVAIDSADFLPLAELQAKAVEKLGIRNVAKGGEGFALDGFFTNREPPQSLDDIGFALDATSTQVKNGTAVDTFFTTGKAA